MKHPAILFASALFILTVALLTYRIVGLGYPLFPTAPGQTWRLYIDAHVKGSPIRDDNKEMNLTLALPDEQADHLVIEERISSGSLNFNLLHRGPNRLGVWAGVAGGEAEVISYQAIIFVHPRRLAPGPKPILEAYPQKLGTEEEDLAAHLTEKWRRLAPPARLRAVSMALTGDWGSPRPGERDLRAWVEMQEKHGRPTAFLALLRAAGLPARPVEGLHLSEGIRTQPLIFIEVWTGQRWESLRVETGKIDRRPSHLLPLATDGIPAAQVSGGEILDIRWIVNREVISQWRLHFERLKRSDRLLDRWSLFRLPPEFQQTFRILLLVPIGALVIGGLRNLVGFPTFGIFMPVLMALAFRNTGLTYGLGIFGGVLLVGYAVRRWMDQLRLLLVPRMSVLLTLVIACFTALALLGSKFGLREFMAVGLLPFVILTMTIERFFVIIEEAGVREGLRTAAGSAAVSIIAYKIVSWEPLQLTFFLYPELLAAVAGVQILLGRYTGYRLVELFRFRTFRGPS